MAKYRLTAAQKDEVRRLTQFANRRIQWAQKEYSRHGKMVLPRELVGFKDLQLKKNWNTPKTPLSRSVVFESREQYQQQIRQLREFERTVPTLTEYQDTHRSLTVQAVETSLGEGIPPSLKERLDRMSAPELSEFWKIYTKHTIRLGAAYSSDSAMRSAMNEYFGEDYRRLLGEELEPTERDLNNMTVKQLRQYAKKNGITLGVHRKYDIIQKILDSM